MGSGIHRDCYRKGFGLSESLEVASLLHIVSIFSGSGSLVCWGLGLGWAGLDELDNHRDAVHVKICMLS